VFRYLLSDTVSENLKAEVSNERWLHHGSRRGLLAASLRKATMLTCCTRINGRKNW
jgi:hypothetical protein